MNTLEYKKISVEEAHALYLLGVPFDFTYGEQAGWSPWLPYHSPPSEAHTCVYRVQVE